MKILKPNGSEGYSKSTKRKLAIVILAMVIAVALLISIVGVSL